MNKDNNFGRLLLLLLLAFGICLGLYYLPDQLFGMKIKKVDLLSDLRIKPESLSMDSLAYAIGTTGYGPDRFGRRA